MLPDQTSSILHLLSVGVNDHVIYFTDNNYSPFLNGLTLALTRLPVLLLFCFIRAPVYTSSFLVYRPSLVIQEDCLQLHGVFSLKFSSV